MLLEQQSSAGLEGVRGLRGQGAEFKSYNVLITGFLRAGKSCEAACLVEEDSADSVEGERGGAEEEIKDKDKAAAG